MPEPAAWALSALLLLAGLAGTVLPGVPGAPLMLAGAVLHRVFLPGYLSGWTLAALGGLAAASLALEFAFTVGGARRLGATSWGLLGAGLGALAGLWFGPLGALAGAVLGAAAAEFILAKQPLKKAAKAGLGAGLGLLASAVGRLGTGLLMIALFLLDCVVY